MVIATGVDPAFSQFYVAKEAGLFEKNGLDVTINTGPSGSAMVPFLINNQVQAAYGSDLAGVINHNVDNNVVAVADGTYLVKWLSLVQANELIGQDRPAAAKMVAKFLKMPLELAVELMPKVEFDMTWTDRAVATIKVAEDQLASQKKLKAPLDYTKYVYTDLLKKVRPENVKITQLPK